MTLKRLKCLTTYWLNEFWVLKSIDKVRDEILNLEMNTGKRLILEKTEIGFMLEKIEMKYSKSHLLE